MPIRNKATKFPADTPAVHSRKSSAGNLVIFHHQPPVVIYYRNRKAIGA